METHDKGIHHILVLAGDAQRNDEFYVKSLRMRLVKNLSTKMIRTPIIFFMEIPTVRQDQPLRFSRGRWHDRATPEYNHGVPGVTKNAIDWASRPAKYAPLNEKPVGILGASPGLTGSARGQSQLRQAFEITYSYCMPQPEILVYRVHQKFDENGNLTDEATGKFLGDYLEALYDWVNKFMGE